MTNPGNEVALAARRAAKLARQELAEKYPDEFDALVAQFMEQQGFAQHTVSLTRWVKK